MIGSPTRLYPLVSVIVPAFNASEYIGETIDSILSQSYPNLEVIVVDDGSTDDTKDRLSAFGNRIAYHYQNNSGVSAARNAGILRSRGELVTCIDADDIMNPGKVSAQVDFIDRNSDVPIVFTDYLNFSGKEFCEKSHFKTCERLMEVLSRSREDHVLTSEEALSIMAEENFTNLGSAPLFRRDALSKVGLYDNFLSQGEDFEFHYRFAKRYPIGVIDTIMLYRRLHADNATKRLGRLYQRAGMSRQKILLYEEDQKLREKIKRWLNELYLALGYDEVDHNKMKSLLLSLYSLKYGCDHRFFKNICRLVLR